MPRLESRWGLLLACLLALLVWVQAPPAAAEEPPPVAADQPTPAAVEGQVTLPLQTWLSLTRKAAPPGPGAAAPAVPVPFMFSRGQYRVTAGDRWARVEGTVSLQVYQPGWVEVPLLGADVVVSRASLDSKPLPTWQKDDHLVFLVDRVGAHAVTATWHLPITLSGATRSLQLKTPASSVSSVRLSVPGKGLTVSSSPPIPLESKDEGGRTLAVGAIPGGGSQEVTFSWTPLRADPKLKGKVNREKARVSGRVLDLVTISENLVQCRIRVDYSILRNEVSGFVIRVPADAEVDDVACAQLATWSEKVAGPHKDILVKLSAPVSGSHTLTLTLTSPLDQPDSAWVLPAVELVGAEKVKGSIGIGSTGGIEVQPGEVSQARPIDVSELPGELREMASFALLRAYEYHAQPWAIGLQTKKGKELPVLTAAVDRAEGLTLVTRDGKRVTTFTYQVRNNQKQSLSLKLPEGATLFTTTLDGKPARPVKGPEGEIRLSLVSSGSGGGTSFPVEVTYAQEAGAAAMFGRHVFRAPEIDLPVSVMNWTLFLPLDEWVYHLGGTMQPGLVAASAPRSGNERGAATAPTADLDLEAGEAGGRPALRREISQEEVLKDSRMSQMVQEASKGTLPVKFTIPARGQSFQFSRLVVTDGEAPEAVIDYYSAALQWAGAGVALVLVLGVGMAYTRRENGFRPMLMALVVLWVAGRWAAETPLEHLLLWMSRGTLLLMALWLYRNRSWWPTWLRWRVTEGAAS